MSSSSDERGPVELLADEFLARCKRGEKPTIKEYCDRHPDLAEEIRDVFEAVLMVEDPARDRGCRVRTASPCGQRSAEQVGDTASGEIAAAGWASCMRPTAAPGGAAQGSAQGTAGNSSARSLREAKRRMHHTNIVPVFDVGQDGDHLATRCS
jgi:hypothetical protein